MIDDNFTFINVANVQLLQRFFLKFFDSGISINLNIFKKISMFDLISEYMNYIFVTISVV